MRATTAPRSFHEARKRRGLSHERLASLIGASRVSISQWESGKHRPSGAARSMLALALDVAPSVVESWFTERAAA